MLKSIGQCALLVFAAIGVIFVLCWGTEVTTDRPDGWVGQQVSIHQQQYRIENAMVIGDGYQVVLKRMP